MLNLVLIALGSVVATAALDRTPRGAGRPMIKPLALEDCTGFWILEESKRDSLSSRPSARDDKHQLDVKAENSGPHAYLGSIKLQDTCARKGPKPSGPDRVPFTYEASGTIVLDDPPAVAPSGTDWHVSLRIALKESCSVTWSEAADAIDARLGPLASLTAEGGRPRHVSCSVAVMQAMKSRVRGPGQEELAPTGLAHVSAADGKPWDKPVPVRFPWIPETRAHAAERFVLTLEAHTPAGTFREQHVYRWAKELPKTLEAELRRQAGRANFRGVRVEKPDTSVQLELTYPAGQSPKVFTSGWLFGARCLVSSPDGDPTDISFQVKWSGTGTFTPPIGPFSRPTFAAPGANSITLSVQVEDRVITKTFPVVAISPTDYVCVGGMARCLSDTHGCPACPHLVTGSITSGAWTVLVGGKPAARVGDGGIHSFCCGPGIFEIVAGDPQVLIDGRPAAKLGSATKHCGGAGTIISSGQ